MAKDRLQGKLAVILHADVAGSTALVKQDEQLAHERIQETFRRFGATITKYQGHVSELRGDALLAEFERASDAVSAALAFQVEQLDYLTQLKDSIQPTVRVGIAMGEVVIADNTITGTGVVLAQRLEQLASPGGVVLQGACQETIPGRFPFDYESLGEQKVKGFDESVRAYIVALKAGAAIPSSVPQVAVAEAALERPTRRWLTFSVIAFLTIVVGGLAWLEPWVQREEPALVERMVFPLPNKPSIAVLPFTNMSDDVQQEYFADGMTDDLITDLSKISSLFVIARNSTFTYKGKSVKVGQVAEELGVRYVLEGSVRRVGNQVRINAQLIDATTGGHLWAERYDGSLQDIFALQDQVTRQIVTALKVSLTGEEEAQKAIHATDNAEAHDAFLQGWAYYKLGTPADFARAIPHFEEAIRLDSGYVRAHAALASLYWDVTSNDWASELGMLSFEAEEGWEEHLELAMKPSNSLAHILRSRVLASLERYSEAAAEAEKAIALDNNDATAYAGLANALILAGRPVEGENLIRKAMRQDPYYPPSYLITLGQAQFEMKHYEAAAGTFERAVKRNVDNEISWIYLAATLAYLNRIDEADAAIESANDLRARFGFGGDLSLESAQGGYSPFWGEIDFTRFGDKRAQEHLRSGLSRLPALTWQYLITVHLIREPGKTRWEVKDAIEIDLTTAKLFHNRGILFISINDLEVWKEGRIPGSINLPLYRSQIDSTRPRLSKALLKNLVKEDEGVVFVGEMHVGSSKWEEVAAAKAVRWGYQQVYYFIGGTSAWKKAGYTIEQDE
jgi:adenylate cyclase